MSAPAVLQLPDGREVQQVTLRSGPMRTDILTLGAIVQGLWLDGLDHSLALGCPDVADYLAGARYFGVIAGRFANRIGNGHVVIDGRAHRTDLNFRGRHTLHGGEDGAAGKIWTIEQRSDRHVLMSLLLPDGHMGFPGNIRMAAQIELTDDALAFDLTAESDAPTPCSLTHHGFFNLDGRSDVRDHRLWIAADHYLPVDDDLIPTGEIATVEGTPFDFRQMRLIGDHGYDHNFCLSDGAVPLRHVATLEGTNGLVMKVETTAPGMQVYDGAHINGVTGHARRYDHHAGLALETQAWPDAPNHPNFPDAILRPGQRYRETTIYRFTR